MAPGDADARAVATDAAAAECSAIAGGGAAAGDFDAVVSANESAAAAASASMTFRTVVFRSERAGRAPSSGPASSDGWTTNISHAPKHSFVVPSV